MPAESRRFSGPIRVEMLGGVRVFAGDGEVEELASQRTPLALLVVLCILGEADREAIVALLWPDSSPGRARHALSQTLYKLRTSLGPDWVQARGDRLIVSGTVENDVGAFEHRLAAGEVESALELYAGPFLGAAPLGVSNAFEVWADTHRARLARMHRQLLRGFLETCIAERHFDRAIRAATHAVTIDPTDDEAQHRLIEALAASGDTREALAQFERYRSALEADGLEPLEQTVELVEQVRVRIGVPASSIPVPAPGSVAVSLDTGAERDTSASRVKSRRSWKAPGYAALALGFAVMAWQWLTGPSSLSVPASNLIRIHVDEFSDHPQGAGNGLGMVLADEIADRLGEVGRFAVIGSSRLRVLRERGIAIGDSALTRPDFIVSGSIESRDSTWSVTVRLIDPSSLRELAFTRESIDPHSGRPGRDRAATRIAEFLRRSVGDSYTARLTATAPGGSPRARDLAAQAAAQVTLADRLMRAGEVHGARTALVKADSLLATAEHSARNWPDLRVARARVAQTLATHYLTAASPAARDSGIAMLRTASSHADAALAIDPDDLDALEARGLAGYRLSILVGPDSSGSLRRRAENDLTSVVERDDRRTQAWRVISDLYWREGEFRNAWVAANYAWETDEFLENAAANEYRLGMALFEMYSDDDAHRRCTAGRTRDPAQPQFRYCLLFLQAFAEPGPRSTDEIWSAVAAADSAIHPNLRPILSARHQMLAAVALSRLGMQDSSTAVFRRASTAAAKDIGRLWYEAAWFLAAGQPDSAAERLRLFANANPDGARQILRGRIFRSLRESGDYPDLFDTRDAPPRD